MAAPMNVDSACCLQVNNDDEIDGSCIDKKEKGTISNELLYPEKFSKCELTNSAGIKKTQKTATNAQFVEFGSKP